MQCGQTVSISLSSRKQKNSPLSLGQCAVAQARRAVRGADTLWTSVRPVGSAGRPGDACGEWDSGARRKRRSPLSTRAGMVEKEEVEAQTARSQGVSVSCVFVCVCVCRER